MSRPRVGAVTIGQAPRPDLLEPLLRRAGDVEVIEVGALDGLTVDRLPSSTAHDPVDDTPSYPLTTRLRDGTRVTLDERDLAPLVQRAIDRAEDAGAPVTLLLCAGGFLGATARGTLVRPFDAAVARLRELGARQVAVVVPFPGQADATRRKWEAAGFEATSLVGDPAFLDAPEAASVHALVFDYVGHRSSDVESLRARSPIPVVDLGEAGADAVVAAIADRLEHASAGSR